MELLGGQAVIDGVMIKNKDKIAIAVRNPKGKIEVKKEKVKPILKNFRNILFLRGIANLIEMIIIGIKALSYSTAKATGEEEKQNTFFLIITVLISVTFALLIFKFLPLLIAQYVKQYYSSSYVVYNLVDGFAKIALFMLYVYIISFMKDVRELFQYHGAEHKVVHCYENRKSLTVKNARKYTTLHPRCGTSFIILVLLISIVVYLFIPKETTFLMKLLLRIILLPVIAAISYELLRFSAKKQDSILFKAVSWFGLMTQKITTKEPNDKQLEVAVRAIKAAI